jgi:hypothetical protein
MHTWMVVEMHSANLAGKGVCLGRECVCMYVSLCFFAALPSKPICALLLNCRLSCALLQNSVLLAAVVVSVKQRQEL